MAALLVNSVDCVKLPDFMAVKNRAKVQIDTKELLIYKLLST